MIERRVKSKVLNALERQAAVALIGPRQVGKTTLALEIADSRPSLYLDLESPADREKLADAEFFLEQYADRLVVMDEIHRVPELFQTLRGLIDAGRRAGQGKGRFLLLGSASISMLRQSGETLAGRIAYVDMNPLDCLEAGGNPEGLMRLWMRGGYPDSYLAPNDAESLALRHDFIRTYLERDVPMFGPRLPAETLGRLWTMLAHGQGSLLNASQLAGSLAISGRSATNYIDLLADLFLVRRLPPYHSHLPKRLVKSPKIYVRDSGMLHALLDLQDYNAIAGHPVVGASWEGFVIENLLAASPPRTHASFYRSAAGAEIDLLLEFPAGERWAIEIKLGTTPRIERGFHSARKDVQPERSIVVYSGAERLMLTDGIEAMCLHDLALELQHHRTA